jgi:hypothetical protein
MTNQPLKSIRSELQQAIVAAPGESITLEMKMQAEKYLSAARSEVIRAVEGLTADQLNFKSSPDRWSIGEIANHVGIVEGNIATRVMETFASAPAPEPGRDCKEAAMRILTLGAEPVEKISAPAQVIPQGQVGVNEAIDTIRNHHNRSQSFLDDTAMLRAHVIPNRAFGVLDGFDWILFIATHYERHLGQINAVKADPGFPTKG